MQYERYHELLELCFRAKEKGIDVFFNYSPHVEGIEVRIHKNKWTKENPKPYKKFDFYISESWQDSKLNGHTVCLEAIAYINDLFTEAENV